ncbi:MAG: hypothetical protein A2X05_06490 [Bacteroidetes bacterium GWE2_41_25]|nr:MAG: hypothetical protein A2X05_06490 [Bacteroidetes bacterium GWE2_41_25]HAM09209.1 hypothetical protein [Bacteroidales bacterium]HCU18240.1 hypothetical protein [Bacteroidales bacterium]
MNSININMNNQEIRRLITSFFEGETTEEEEKLLRALFSGDQVPGGFEAEKEYILFCLANGNIKDASNNLEGKIIRAIDKQGIKAESKHSRRYYLMLLSGAAAIMLIVFGTYFFINSRKGFRDTYSDPAIAYAETMKLLMDVSSRLNKGTSALRPVSKLSEMTDMSREKLNETSSTINKSLLKLNVLKEVNSDKNINDTIDVNN